MKNKLIYAPLLAVNLLLASCSGFLNEEPYDFTAPDLFFNTQSEAISALGGVYDYLHNEQIGDFDWQFKGDCGADVAICRNILRYNVYQYYEMESLPVQIVTSWRMHYKAIGDANMVIERTKKMNLSDKVKSQIIAEASFLRAYFYHQLVLMWGNVPYYTDEVTGVNQSTIGGLPNTPAKEVNAKIISDLSYAIDNLPDTRPAEEFGRATKWAAKGLLSRVYLFDNQWENASKVAKEIVANSSGKLLNDFASIFDANNAMNKEVLFAVPFLTDVRGQWLHTIVEPATVWEPFKHDYTVSQIIRPDGKIATKTSDFIRGWGVYYLSKEFSDSFAKGDKRKDATVWHWVLTTKGDTIFFKDKADGTAYYNLKWTSLDDKEINGSKPIILMRLAEVYLILAEAENELNNGPTAAAYDAINAIRRRAFGDNGHDVPAGLSKEDFKRAIINENRWELGGEGLRTWYLKHWGYDELRRAVESIKATNPNAVKNLKPHHLLYKIPDEELIKNPNLKQNPGY